MMNVAQNIVAEVQNEKAQVSETTAVSQPEGAYVETFPAAEQEGSKILDTPVVEQQGHDVLVFPKVEQEPAILVFPHVEPAKPQIESFPAEKAKELGDSILWANKGNEKVKENSKTKTNNREEMLGENGTQVASETTWQNGKTERIDVENPSPGKRPGQIHYHEPNNTKWYLDIVDKVFYNPKTGELASKKIQKLLNNSDVIKGINKALKLLGENKLK